MCDFNQYQAGRNECDGTLSSLCVLIHTQSGTLAEVIQLNLTSCLPGVGSCWLEKGRKSVSAFNLTCKVRVRESMGNTAFTGAVSIRWNDMLDFTYCCKLGFVFNLKNFLTLSGNISGADSKADIHNNVNNVPDGIAQIIPSAWVGKWLVTAPASDTVPNKIPNL